MYEVVNWESFLAFNNSYGLTNIPTGAVIANTGLPNQQTAGGTITAGNLAIPPILPQWDSSSPLYGNLSASAINCDPIGRGPLPYYERRSQSDDSIRLDLDLQRATRVYSKSIARSWLCWKSRNQSDGHSRYQSGNPGDQFANYSAVQRAVRLAEQHLPDGEISTNPTTTACRPL